MPYQPGQVVANRYRIVKRLAQGGFGAVYRAWDLNLRVPCALKENLELSPAAQRQFEREATWLAGLSHPNLPRVTDHFSEPGPNPGDPPAQYLVMDYIDGQDLDQIVTQNGPVSEHQAIQWITQVLSALEYLHNQTPPLVHRDVKPANIRINPEGNAILVDFGLVKKFDPNRGTTTGAMAVSPGYSPPEQYGQGNTDARSDIYSLGATLYKLLTGIDPQESVLRIVQDEIIPVHQTNPGVSLRTSQIVQVAMAMSPTQRFPSATSFKHTLQGTIHPPRPNGSGIPITISNDGQPTQGTLQDAMQPPTSIQPPQTIFPHPITEATTGVVSFPSQVKTKIDPKMMWVIIGGILLMLCISIPTGVYIWKNVIDGNTSEPETIPIPTRTYATPEDIVITPGIPTPTATETMTNTDTPRPQHSPSPTVTLSPQATSTSTRTATPAPPTRTPTRTRTPTEGIPVPVDQGSVAGYDLAFASDINGNFTIFLMNTVNRSSWTSLPPPSGYELAWWPSFCGPFIAGEVADLNGSSPQWIYLVDPAGDLNDLWRPATAGAGLGVPRCSPSGEYLAYSTGSSTEWDMYVARINGSAPFLVDNIGISGYASWFSDNNRMYSMAGSSGTFSIRFATNLLLPTRFNIQHTTPGKYPAVSPDGSQVAYICGDDLRLCLWNVSNRSSSTLHAITYERVNDQRIPASPAWSADGQWIYFASADDGDWDIYRIHPNGSGYENITPDWPSNELMPALQW